jgi:hypothetical protein
MEKCYVLYVFDEIFPEPTKFNARVFSCLGQAKAAALEAAENVYKLIYDLFQTSKKKNFEDGVRLAKEHGCDDYENWIHDDISLRLVYERNPDWCVIYHYCDINSLTKNIDYQNNIITISFDYLDYYNDGYDGTDTAQIVWQIVEQDIF